MSHPHAIITDEDSEKTIGTHQLPQPIGWKVLVQPNPNKTKTKGGILLPSQSQENQEYLTAHGKILATGELKAKLDITAHFASKHAQEKIEKVGGKLNIIKK